MTNQPFAHHAPTSGQEVLLEDGRVGVIVASGSHAPALTLPADEVVVYTPSPQGNSASVQPVATLRPVSEVATYISTPEAAQSVIRALMQKFSLAGTHFGQADLESIVASALEGESVEAEHYAPALVKALEEHYTFRKMDDLLAERGNEALAEAAEEIVREIFHQPGVTYSVVAGVDDASGQRVAVLEGPAFDSFTEAHTWGVERLGMVAATVLAEEGVDHYDGNQETEGLPLAGFTVCVYSPLAEETRTEVDYHPLG